jgi:hypothetical protein
MLKQVDLKDGVSGVNYGMNNAIDVDKLQDVAPNRYKMIQNKDLFDNNFAFVSTTLSKLHSETYDPIWYVTYPQDISIDVGGGFVDYIEYFTINWVGIQEQTENLFGNQGSIIPRVNASANQATARVYTYEIAYDLKFVDIEKLNTLKFQKSITQIYQEAIRAGFELFAQVIAYTGVSASGDNGMFNNTQVKIYSVPAGVSTGTKFKDLTDEEIVSFFNGVMAEYLTNTNWNLDMLPDSFLLPSEDAQELSNRFSALYTRNLRDYLLENNFGVDEVKGSPMQGSYQFKIKGRPQLDSLGTASNGRIVVYRNEKRFIRMDMPYPLQAYYTGPNVERGAYTTFFIGQISKVQMPYNDGTDGEFGPVTYWDFGADL